MTDLTMAVVDGRKTPPLSRLIPFAMEMHNLLRATVNVLNSTAVDRFGTEKLLLRMIEEMLNTIEHPIRPAQEANPHPQPPGFLNAVAGRRHSTQGSPWRRPALTQAGHPESNSQRCRMRLMNQRTTTMGNVQERHVLDNLRSLRAEEMTLNEVIDKIRALNGVLAEAEAHIMVQHGIVEAARLALIVAIAAVSAADGGGGDNNGWRLQQNKEAWEMLTKVLNRIEDMIR